MHTTPALFMLPSPGCSPHAPQVGPEDHVICALSGGVDSTVAATLVHKVCVWVGAWGWGWALPDEPRVWQRSGLGWSGHPGAQGGAQGPYRGWGSQLTQGDGAVVGPWSVGWAGLGVGMGTRWGLGGAGPSGARVWLKPGSGWCLTTNLNQPCGPQVVGDRLHCVFVDNGLLR